MQRPDTPLHVVIIPDGNRRWAKQKLLPSLSGHMKGYLRVKELLGEANQQGVQFLTLWAFSTENWLRGKEEVEDLMSVIHKGLLDIETHVHEEKIRFVHLGRKDRLSPEIVSLLSLLEESTKAYTAVCLCLAIDYGGEDEINRASKEMLAAGDQTRVIRDFLDTTKNGIPDPDLIIRTSGEKRTSGIMPLQSAYSEWFFEEVLFPDFTAESFRGVLEAYTRRVRRFGK